VLGFEVSEKDELRLLGDKFDNLSDVTDDLDLYYVSTESRRRPIIGALIAESDDYYLQEARFSLAELLALAKTVQEKTGYAGDIKLYAGMDAS
jgi:hypothetical protein